MPELPEVEVSRMGITPHLEGQVISAIKVRNPRLRWPVPAAIQNAVGERINKIERRAKYLLLRTAAGTIILHLGMSGRLRVIDAGTPAEKHDHIDIVVAHKRCLRLTDPRRFGACLWHTDIDEALPLLANLGPEPLTGDFDQQRLFTLSRNKQLAVKNFIMDNKVVVGVGNIYANEALFLSKIDPRRAAGKISANRYSILTDNIRQVLSEAIKQGGTTLKDFTQTDGKPGYFAQRLRVYGRTGEACDLCGSGIKSIVIGQRNTFYCPQCQR